MKRILLYGGAFDPPHLGHERLLSAAIEYVEPDITVVTPTPRSPHKTASSTPFADRAAMAGTFKKLADNMIISGIEKTKNHKKSYTLKTVRRLKKRYKNCGMYLLIGSDMLLGFEKWHRYRRLLAETVIVAAAREDEDRESVASAARRLACEGGRIEIIEFSPLEVSSTEIRAAIAENGDVSELVSGEVLDYINKHGLYGGKR